MKFTLKRKPVADRLRPSASGLTLPPPPGGQAGVTPPSAIRVHPSRASDESETHAVDAVITALVRAHPELARHAAELRTDRTLLLVVRERLQRGADVAGQAFPYGHLADAEARAQYRLSWDANLVSYDRYPLT